MITLVYLFIAIIASAQTVSDPVQIPPVVQMQLQTYQDRFQQILAEECPGALCTATGCEITSFATLDEQQDASLPGLETPKDQTSAPQYKLTGVRCEFAYEATLNNEALNSLKQRLQAKAKAAGTSLGLTPRKLAPKAEAFKNFADNQEPTDPKPPANADEVESPWQSLLPWMAFASLLTLLSLLLIWGFRRIGRPKTTALSPLNLTAAKENLISKDPTSEPTAAMILARVQHLKENLQKDPQIAMAFKPLLQAADIKTLCQILRHFGPEALTPFNGLVEFKDALTELRLAYQNFTEGESNFEIWQFLDKIERLFVASEVGTVEPTLQEEFGFIQNLEADEFFRLLQTLEEDDLPMILSFAPTNLQNCFFQKLDSIQLMNLMEKLSTVNHWPDKVVREKIHAIRQIYQSRQSELKTVAIDRFTLMEQILNSLSSKDRQQLIAKLGAGEAGLLENSLSRMFMDETLTLIPGEVLNDVFLQIAPEKAAAYLDSLPYRERILSRLNSTLAQSIRRWTKTAKGLSSTLTLNLAKNESAFVEDEQNQLSLTTAKRAEAGRNEIAHLIREYGNERKINLRALNQSLLQDQH